MLNIAFHDHIYIYLILLIYFLFEYIISASNLVKIIFKHFENFLFKEMVFTGYQDWDNLKQIILQTNFKKEKCR